MDSPKKEVVGPKQVIEYASEVSKVATHPNSPFVRCPAHIVMMTLIAITLAFRGGERGQVWAFYIAGLIMLDLWVRNLLLWLNTLRNQATESDNDASKLVLKSLALDGGSATGRKSTPKKHGKSNKSRY
jgi:hypothetical protein